MWQPIFSVFFRSPCSNAGANSLDCTALDQPDVPPLERRRVGGVGCFPWGFHHGKWMKHDVAIKKGDSRIASTDFIIKITTSG